jgi:hypothetical protein
MICGGKSLFFEDWESFRDNRVNRSRTYTTGAAVVGFTVDDDS